MAFALLILDKDGHEIVSHVANYADDTVYVEDWQVYDLPQSEWRKSHHLTDWVRVNKPDWTIRSKAFEPANLFLM